MLIERFLLVALFFPLIIVGAMPAYKIKTDFNFNKKGKSFSTMSVSGHIILDEIHSEEVSTKLKKMKSTEGFMFSLLLQHLWIYCLKKKKKKAYWPKLLGTFESLEV